MAISGYDSCLVEDKDSVCNLSSNIEFHRTFTLITSQLTSRTKCTKLSCCLILSATLHGLPILPWFFSWTRWIFLPKRSSNHKYQSISQITKVREWSIDDSDMEACLQRLIFRPRRWSGSNQNLLSKKVPATESVWKEASLPTFHRCYGYQAISTRYDSSLGHCLEWKPSNAIAMRTHIDILSFNEDWLGWRFLLLLHNNTRFSVALFFLLLFFLSV